MFNTMTQGTPSVQDQNVNRLIEETLRVVNDIDQRLMALKVGIASAVPQLVPVLAQRELQAREQTANVLARLQQVGPSMTQSPFGAGIGGGTSWFPTPYGIGQPQGQAPGFGQQGLGMNIPGFIGASLGFPTPFAGIGQAGIPAGNVGGFGAVGQGVPTPGVLGSFRHY